MQLVVASTPDSTVDLVTFDFWAQVLHFGSCITPFSFVTTCLDVEKIYLCSITIILVCKKKKKK